MACKPFQHGTGRLSFDEFRFCDNAGHVWHIDIMDILQPREAKMDAFWLAPASLISVVQATGRRFCITQPHQRRSLFLRRSSNTLNFHGKSHAKTSQFLQWRERSEKKTGGK